MSNMLHNIRKWNPWFTVSKTVKFARICWTVIEKSRPEHNPNWTRCFHLLPTGGNWWRHFRWKCKDCRGLGLYAVLYFKVAKRNDCEHLWPVLLWAMWDHKRSNNVSSVLETELKIYQQPSSFDQPLQSVQLHSIQLSDTCESYLFDFVGCQPSRPIYKSETLIGPKRPRTNGKVCAMQHGSRSCFRKNWRTRQLV